MAPSTTSVAQKESFLQENQMFTELELTEESRAIGNIQDISLKDNEIWLLQCPKAMDIRELETQTLKMPGRTSLNLSEAIAMELTEADEQHAFAYYNRKGRYALRLLPVRGTIVVRDRLRAAETVTTERVEECCPAAKRVPMPSNMKVRHPLLGFQFEDKLTLNKSVAKRLQKADEISAQILKDSLAKKMEASPKTTTFKKSTSKKSTESLAIEINGAEDDDNDDDAVEFVSEEKAKKKKKKRKHSESMVDEMDSNKLTTIKKKSKKSPKNEETISKDLQWLQNI